VFLEVGLTEKVGVLFFKELGQLYQKQLYQEQYQKQKDAKLRPRPTIKQCLL